MDLLGFLSNLMNNGGKQPAKPQAQMLQRMPTTNLQPIQRQPNYQPSEPIQPLQNSDGLVNGYKPEPGYYNQAVEYSNAFNPTPGHPYGTSDTNPMVVGPNAIDPMHFGYPADNSAQAPQRQTLMESNPYGQPRMSNQAGIPANQQQDTWLQPYRQGQTQPYQAPNLKDMSRNRF